MLELLLGSGLAVAALAYVLWPVLSGVRGVTLVARPLMDAPEATALEAMREIEFDRATGKLSTEDYDALRARYAPLAVAELKARDTASAAGDGAAGRVSTPATGDAAEALIARMRSQRGLTCPTHGARPESDAIFCSDCGRFLGTSCPKCGAAVQGDQSRFCGECGASLAA